MSICQQQLRCISAQFATSWHGTDFAPTGICFQSTPCQLLQQLLQDCHVTSFCALQNFQPMYNQMAAVWVASNLPPPPLDVRIVSVTGQSVTAV